MIGRRWFSAGIGWRFFPGLLLLALAACCLTGCSGNKRYTVTGLVTLRGHPLSSGLVRVFGPGDHLWTAPLRADGTFTVTDVPPGEIRVSVVEAKKRMASPGGTNGPGTAPAGKTEVIPARYKDVSTSGLVFTLAPGQRLEINLQ
jgi:hypothetical protein